MPKTITTYEIEFKNPNIVNGWAYFGWRETEKKAKAVKNALKRNGDKVRVIEVTVTRRKIS